MRTYRYWLALLVCLPLGNVVAHEGHDHGADPQPVVGSVAPRFEARSDLFELVGVLQGGELVIYLDRAADNAPLRQGEIEIESGALRGKATADASGIFRLKAGGLAQPGKHVLTLTVAADGEVDLLTATFEHGPPDVTAATAFQPGLLAKIAGAVVVLLGLAWVWQSRRKRSVA